MKAAVICLGNELLIGRTVNTNATFISHELTKLGFSVTHHVVLPDIEESIVDGFSWIKSLDPDVVVVSGGLGATHDDIQIGCISKFTGRALVLNEEALGLLQKRYGENGLTDFRRKMAMLPEGSFPLNNSKGAAPGSVHEIGSQLWFSLPGVPREMKAIMIEEVVPYLKSKFETSRIVEYGFRADGVYESMVAPQSAELQKRHGGIVFKSHPRRGYLSLHVYSLDPDREEEVRSAVEEWREIIRGLGGKVGEISQVFDDNFLPET